MWSLAYHEGFQTTAKGFLKRHRNPFTQAIANVQDLVEFLSLEASMTIQQATQPKCYHNEKQGLYAADQSPSRRGVAEIRLYFYPDEVTRTVHLIRIGDKDSQQKDIALCRPIVEQIRNSSRQA